MNNSPLPNDVCEREPALKQYGFYRRLNNGKIEFMSFCNPKANEWIAAREKDLNEILNKTLPKEVQ